ncbi:MAG: hypothetical protein EAZ43_09295 [Betaproteobacteria bacterium]|nr:MAG: hypothetical protein EAZ43_09295 [Betaproteobacteria bacterium]
MNRVATPIVVVKKRVLALRAKADPKANSASPASAISRIFEPMPTPLHIVYCGRHGNGSFRLLIADKRFLLKGAIFTLSQQTDHRGNVRSLKLLMDMTPGYRVSSTDEQSFEVVERATGARMFVIGQVTPFVKPSAASARAAA